MTESQLHYLIKRKRSNDASYRRRRARYSAWYQANKARQTQLQRERRQRARMTCNTTH